MTRLRMEGKAPMRESCCAGGKGTAARLSLLPCCAAQALYGPVHSYVARALYLLAALHLQRWEYCHSLGEEADPAYLLRSANMATSASRYWAVRALHRPQGAARVCLRSV